MAFKNTFTWITYRVGLPLLAFLLIGKYVQNIAAEITILTLGFYVVVLLFLSTASRSEFGVSSFGYGFVRSMLRVVSPFIWAIIALTFLYAITHLRAPHGVFGTGGYCG